MASLPTVSDREVLTSLKNQENLLENIARAITKREEGLTKRDTEVKKDKRTIDEQQEKSTIKKILESFTRMGTTRMNAQEIQFKTFEETKLTKNIAQRTGLDIEFIRKSFEEGQKKKDRELLAQTIAGAINGATGGGGVKGMLGAGLFGAGIAALLGGLKTVVTTIGKTLYSLLSPVFSAVIRAMFTIARGIGGGVLGKMGGALGAAGAAMLNPYVAAAVAGGTVGKFGTDYIMDAIEERENKRALLRAGTGFAGKSMQENEEMLMNLEMAETKGRYRKAAELNLINKETQDKVSKASDPMVMIAEMNKALQAAEKDIQNSKWSGAKRIQKAGEDAKMELFDKYYEARQQELIEQAEMEKSKLEMGDFAKNLQEGGDELDGALKDFMGIAKEKVDVVGKKIKDSLFGLGSIKDAEGKEMFNVFEGMGGLMQGIYESAMKEYQDLTSGEGVGKGDMNTQVNTTNVLGGQQTPMIFPNANAIDTNPSVGAYLRKNGVIRY